MIGVGSSTVSSIDDCSAGGSSVVSGDTSNEGSMCG